MTSLCVDGSRAPARSTSLLFLGAALGLVLCSAVAHAENKEERRMSSGDTGKDPRAFTTAQQMYRTAAKSPFDSQAASLVSAVSSRLDHGEAPERTETWEALVKLNPYRETGQIQAEVSRWAKLCA